MKLFCVTKKWNRRVLEKTKRWFGSSCSTNRLSPIKRSGSFTSLSSNKAYVRVNGKRSVRLVAMESYKPVEKDELAVAAGDLLYGVYCYNNDWLYVVNEQGDEGFVPSRVCEFAYRHSVVRNEANTVAMLEVNQPDRPPPPRISKSRTASPAGLENVNRFLKTLSICSELDSFTRPQSESPQSSGWNEPTHSLCSIGASSDDSFRNLGQLLPVAAGTDKRNLFLQAYNTGWNDGGLAMCQTNC